MYNVEVIDKPTIGLTMAKEYYDGRNLKLNFSSLEKASTLFYMIKSHGGKAKIMSDGKEIQPMKNI